MTNLLVKAFFLLALVALLCTFLLATALGNNAHHLHSTHLFFNLSLLGSFIWL